MELYRILRAAAFAARMHKDQKRKGPEALPYIVHPLEVAALVHEQGGDENMVIAALLHDTVEDTEATLEEIGLEFGPDVMLLVDELTDKFPAGVGGNRKERKEKERARMATVSARAKRIKLADIQDNMKDIDKNDMDFAPTFRAEKEALLKVLLK